MSDWQEVWECPTCGLQLAAGEKGANTRIQFNRPKCQMAHSPVEMEQKLSEAMPFGPEEAA